MRGRPRGRPRLSSDVERPLDRPEENPTSISNSLDKAIGAVEMNGIMLRMKAIARLDLLGMDVQHIAVELSKSNASYSIEVVNRLMGLDQAQDEEGRERLRSLYSKIRSEAEDSSILQPDRELEDLQCLAISAVKAGLEAAMGSPAGVELGLKALKAVGVGNETTQVVEYRMDEGTREALLAMRDYRKPSGGLARLLDESGFDKPDA